uniref:Capsule gland specific secretory protein n=1 Tax=Reishia bronni TaxID=578817 RepID=A0A6G9KPA4_9CAEN|nr:capsule gland specific secretory protein [Reishia bronni]
MKLFLAAVLLVAAVEAASLGGDPCTWGPSYWCGSVQTARACKAFPHCLKRVWTKQSIQPVQLTKECLYSEKLVKTIRHLLTLDKGYAEASYLLGSMCSFVGDDALRKECKTLVTDFLPEIFKLINSDLDPSSVVTVLGLCKPQEEKATGKKHIVAMEQGQNQVFRVHEGKPVAEEGQGEKGKSAEKEKVGESVECETCKVVVTAVDDLLSSNASEAAIQNALDGICQRLPSSISIQCKSFVDEYTAMVVKLLVQELDPHQICLDLELCQSSQAEWTAPSASAGPACLMCEMVVGEVETLIKENKTEKAIEDALDKVCSLLPPSISTECTSIINVYAPTIIRFLLQEVPPHKVCATIGLCSSFRKVQEALQKLKRVRGKSASSVECDVCKMAFSEIKTMLGNEQTQQEIIQAVETVCDLVSGDLRKQCQSEVENYGPAVLDLLLHMDDPTKVCTDLHLCAATPSAKSLPQGKKKMVGTKECTFGPSFWCASMENARKCGMEQECVQKYGLKP